MDHLDIDLIRVIREGDVDKASRLIDTFGLSFSEAWFDGYILLCEALEGNHTEMAKVLLEYGPRVHNPGSCPRNTPLHIAVKNKNLEIVTLLLSDGAHPNARNHLGETPLYLSIESAAEFGIPEIMLQLLNYGAKVDAHAANGYTMLHCACVKGNEEIVQLLLDRGVDINARTGKRATALHLAAEMKFHKIVKVLLEHGIVDIDAEDDRGKTVLNIAMEQGHLPTLQRLLEICPGVNNERNRHCIRDYLCGLGKKRCSLPIVDSLLSHGFSVHREDADDRKLLHNAVEGGFTKIVDVLLRYGANVDSPYVEKKGCTLLHIATINEQLDIAEMLIKHGADVNVIDDTGTSPISYAIQKKHAKMTKLLVTNGAEIKFRFDFFCSRINSDVKEIMEIMLDHDVDYDIMDKDMQGQTALWCAITLASSHNCKKRFFNKKMEEYFSAERDLVELLLSRGANVNTRDIGEESVLHIAVGKGRVDLVETLLGYNADVNSPTEICIKTPLHYASKQNDEIIIDILLKFGANIDSKDRGGSTPLHVAAVHGCLKAVKTLLKSFADVECTNKHGKTALYVASKNGWSGIVEELLDYSADPIKTCKEGHSLVDRTIAELSERKMCCDMTRVLKNYSIRMKSLIIHDRKENLESFAQCEREIGMLKSERIGVTNVSYYDVLMKSMNQLAMLARNKDVVEVLVSSDSSAYRTKFPIYCKMLYYKFRKGQKRADLLNPCMRAMHFLLSFPLPELASLKLFDNLSNKELENIIKAVPEIESG